ncbi:glycosyltransferase [Flavobacterium sp. Arc2]|uniref:glycosyltransferase n=1 Tax=Flavobacterium sp. Arc2 TaxID=3046685 RepID=UPI00352D3D25
MISIIICSRTQTISSDLFENIKDTIGCDYELVVIDNSENTYSIFEAYNLGIEQSKGDFLCFMHDDILIHTQNWGNILGIIFNSDSQIGLIGIAGSSQKTKTPSGWWDCDEKYKSINIIQHYPDGKVIKEYLGFENSNLNEVVFVDGVFLALRKEINVFFDEKLKGFHNYDFNVSIETKKKNYKIGITNKVLIEHFSVGNLNDQWINSTIQIHRLYQAELPLSLSIDRQIDNEIFACKRFLSYCIKASNKQQALRFSVKWYLYCPLSKHNFVFFFKTVLKIFKL